MRIPRPPTEYEQLGAGELIRHLLGMTLIRLPGSSIPLNWFFARCPALFTKGAIFKFTSSTDVLDVLQSASNARKVGFHALGYDDEAAGALFITSGKLEHLGYSLALSLHQPHLGVSEWKQRFLEAFEALGEIRLLPGDDTEYWQDRFAETAAALLPSIAGYDHSGGDAIRARLALVGVASVAARLVPYRPGSAAAPLPVAHYRMGGRSRVHVALAHTEVIAGRAADAVSRLSGILNSPITPLEDEFYALIVGLAAARGAGRMDLHAGWLYRIHALVDTARERYRSAPGRLYEVQVLYHEVRYATETWAVSIHHPDDLLSLAEIFKARLLLDHLSGARIQAVRPLRYSPPPAVPAPPSEPREEEDELSPAELDQIKLISLHASGILGGLENPDPEFDFLQKIHEQTSEELRSTEQETVEQQGGFAASVSPCSPSEIRNTLEPDELLIEYMIPRDPFSPNKEVWIITTDVNRSSVHGLYVHSTPRNQSMVAGHVIERGPLSDRIAQVRTAIRERRDEDAKEILRLLFVWLIEPVIAMGHSPEAYKRWIFVGHGPIHLLPIHALIDEDGRFLIERVPTTTVPSASVWMKQARDGQGTVTSALTVGNPRSGHLDGWSDLYDAEDEAVRVKNHLPPDVCCTVLTRERASEAAVKRHLLEASLLHFAAHGQLDVGNPDSHRILLGTEGAEDGYLLAKEVGDLDLSHVRLAVLNICDGVVCRYGPGDEPLGLLSAFISAGVQNVIGGLWDLSDAAAKLFIIDFYRTLFETDPATARQYAAVRSISRGRSLAFWAGFELVGPGRPLKIVPSDGRMQQSR